MAEEQGLEQKLQNVINMVIFGANILLPRCADEPFEVYLPNRKPTRILRVMISDPGYGHQVEH